MKSIKRRLPQRGSNFRQPEYLGMYIVKLYHVCIMCFGFQVWVTERSRNEGFKFHVCFSRKTQRTFERTQRDIVVIFHYTGKSHLSCLMSQMSNF